MTGVYGVGRFRLRWARGGGGGRCMQRPYRREVAGYVVEGSLHGTAKVARHAGVVTAMPSRRCVHGLVCCCFPFEVGIKLL